MTTATGDWTGQVLDRRYHVTAKLGQGGMGFVLRARDTRLDCDVVIKVPRADLLADAEFRQRFEEEIRALVKLAHPHVVKITDVGRHEGVPFAVMQFLPGGSLDDVRRKDERGRPRPAKPKMLAKWLPDVAEALDFMHARGYVHRDVKPANILFDEHGHAYLSDFGIAKALAGQTEDRRGLTGTGMVLGTPEYMAPEMVLGKPTDGRADQYALAITVYELLSGTVPFDGPTGPAVLVRQSTEAPASLSEVAPSVPAGLAAAVAKALTKEPAQRFPDCATFAKAALAGATGPAPAPRREPAPKPRVTPTRVETVRTVGPTLRSTAAPPRSKVPIVLAGGGVLASVALAAVVVVLLNRSPKTPDEVKVAVVTPTPEPVSAPAAPTTVTPTPAPAPAVASVPDKPPVVVPDPPPAPVKDLPKPNLPAAPKDEPKADEPTAGEPSEPKAPTRPPRAGSKARTPNGSNPPPGTIRPPLPRPTAAGFHAAVGKVGGIAVAPDGLAAVVWGSSSARLYRLPDGDALQTYGTEEVRSAAVSPSGRHVVTGSGALVHCWDVGGAEVWNRVQHGRRAVTGVAFAGPGEVVSVAADGAMVRRDPATAREIGRIQVGAGPLNEVRLAATADGRLLLTRGGLLYIAGKGVPTPRAVSSADDRLHCVAVGGERALAGSEGGPLHLYDVRGTRLRRWDGHTGAVRAVGVSRDGSRGLSGGDDGSVRLWDLADGKELARFDAPSGAVAGVAFLPDGRRAVSAAADGAVRLWDLPE